MSKEEGLSGPEGIVGITGAPGLEGANLANPTGIKPKVTKPKTKSKVLYTKQCPPGHSHATIEAQQEIVMEAAKHMLSEGIIEIVIKKGKGNANDVHTVKFV